MSKRHPTLTASVVARQIMLDLLANEKAMNNVVKGTQITASMSLHSPLLSWIHLQKEERGIRDGDSLTCNFFLSSGLTLSIIHTEGRKIRVCLSGANLRDFLIPFVVLSKWHTRGYAELLGEAYDGLHTSLEEVVFMLCRESTIKCVGSDGQR